MSDISPLSRSQAPLTNPASTRQGQPDQAPAAARGRDQADFSTAATLLSRLNALPDVRQDLVERVREQINAGTYETPEKLDQALTGLAEDLTG